MMSRAASRGVGAGVGGSQEPFTNRFFTVKRPSRSPCSHPSSSSMLSRPVHVNVSSSSTGWSPSARFFCDAEEWESVGFEQEEMVDGGVQNSEFWKHRVLGPVPSRNEAERAMSSLQHVLFPVVYIEDSNDGFPFLSAKREAVSEQVIDPAASPSGASSSETELDWIEPSLHIQSPRILPSVGCRNVLDAFRLLHTDPAVQRMVVSLASDKAVWDAVMKNEAVREFQESFYADEKDLPNSYHADQDVAMKILRWVLEKAKERIIKFIDRIADLLADLFQPLEQGKNRDAFEEAVRSSFMLSVIVLVLVVIARGHRS